MKVTRTNGISLRRGLRAWRGMRARRYPGFVYDEGPQDEPGIPVFTYHSLAGRETPDSITPEEFERDLQHLARNGYVSLSADELYAYLITGGPCPERAVVLTFDDGRATLWTVAHPLLERYGFKGVCFLVPASISNRPARRVASPSAGAVPDDLSETPAVSWDEVRRMHASGTIDFQSHTLDHALIHCAPQITNFIHPEYRVGFGAYGVPVVSEQGRDRGDRLLPLGTPVYAARSRMEAARRFFDDEGLRAACVDFVSQNGGPEFFTRSDWREALLAVAAGYRQHHHPSERYETPEEQRAAIRRSLAESKQQIEQQLPGHVVRHLCYPWHRYSMLAAALAQEVGYVASFIDINPQRPRPHWNDPYTVQHRLPLNVYGDDPHQISRIDARESVVQSLPGEGRITYRQRLIWHLRGRWS